MKSPKQIMTTLTLLLSLMIAGSALALDVGSTAPDFTLKSRSGENIKLSEQRGDVVMINFWASWCAPCRQEMPLLEELHDRYADLGFTLLGVNVEEDSNAALDLLKEIPVTFPVLFDSRNDVSKRYNVVAMPTTVILDRDGNVRYVHKGYLPGYEDEYRKQIKELIRE
ncbi:MAG TPA: TlpA family protein disulfide reductase [Gammaproteobacteria bacterium]|nr:TlpA family protein disulfide reductase [Gammaproteobacteria bacterium]